MQVMIVLSVGVSIITILSACFILRRVKKQIIHYMVDKIFLFQWNI